MEVDAQPAAPDDSTRPAEASVPPGAQPEAHPEGQPEAQPEVAPSTTEVTEAGTSGIKTLEDVGAQLLFEKVLTSSDANGQGRIVLPKAQASEHLPHLEQQSGMVLDFEDTEGTPHSFRFRFWTNNQSRMYLLEGMQEVQARYRIGTGDTVQFGKLLDGKLVVCGKKGGKARAPPVRARAASNPITPQLGPRKRARGRPPKASQNFGLLHSPCFMLAQDDGSGPVCDGVFRALPDGQSEAGKVGVAPKRGLWTATISLAGETYQAFFDTADAATEALNAAGFCA